MPRYCCVPNCTSNRPGKDYVTCFRFPKDDESIKLWKKKIPRDFEVKPDTVVCANHFSETDIIRTETVKLRDGSTINKTRKIPKLKDGAYPSIFPNCPSYLSEPPAKRTVTFARCEKMKKWDDKEMKEWLEKDKIDSLEIIAEKLNDKNSNMLSFNWGNEYIFHVCDNCITFLFFSCNPNPKLIKSLKIDKDLMMSFAFNDKIYSGQQFSDLFKIPSKLNCWSQLENLLNYVKHFTLESFKSPETDFDKSLKHWQLYIDNECSAEKVASAKFIQEQMVLLNKTLQGVRYSTELLIFSYCIYIKSTVAYGYLHSTNIIQIPSLRHLKRLSANIQVTPGIRTNENFSFLQGRCNSLSEKERIVNLLIDEIYIKPTITFKSQTICGFAEKNEDSATTIQAFMFSSLFCKAKEIVALVPVSKLNAIELHGFTLKVLDMLETLGFTVLSVISDNNRVNRNMFMKLCGGNEMKVCIPNPFNPSKKLFLLFDSVHLIKSLRNNWLNQKDDKKPLIFPDPKIFFNPQVCSSNSNLNVASASFSLLRSIYQEESLTFLKMAPKLTLKALNPSNIERQNVSLALKIFDRSNVCTLRMFKERENCANPKIYEETACFIEKVISWWEIMNVKTPNKGQRLRLSNCEPVTYENQSSLDFLQSFALWIKAWENMKQKNREGGLSRETFFALSHSTLCIVSIIKYLLNELKVQYVLCGKFQTDNLEARFGQYRQMSGSNYYISVQEIMESEKKLRVKSLLNVKSEKYGSFSVSDLFSSHCFEHDSSIDANIDNFLPILDNLTDFDRLSKNDLKVLSYIGGYCVHKLQIACGICVQYFVTMKDIELSDNEHLQYLQMLDRGGLKIPSVDIITLLSVCYEIFCTLVSSTYESVFLNFKNQVMLLVKLTTFSIEDSDLVNLDEICSCCAKTRKFYIGKILRTFSNICINNYVKHCNSVQKIKKDNKKLRKLQNQ